MTDFRDLCTELLLFAEQAGEICHHEGLWPNCDQQQVCVDGKPLWLLDRVRAALAEPKSEVPTDEELKQWYSDCADETTMGAAEHHWAFEVPVDYANDFARAVLARWGANPRLSHPTP